MKRFNENGFTLIEMALYIGVMVIVLPALVVFLLQLQQTQGLFNARSRMEQSAALIHAEMSNELISAKSIRLTSSVFDSDDGEIVFDDLNNDTIYIDRELTTVDYSGTIQVIRRLRMKKGLGAWNWITDTETDVDSFYLEAVRNSESDLTGIKLHLEFIMLNPGGNPHRQANFNANSTINLQPQTVEI